MGVSVITFKRTDLILTQHTYSNMRTITLLFIIIISFFINGVFGDAVKSLSVIEGDSLTLHTDITDITASDALIVTWTFGPQNTKIAQIDREAKIFFTDDVQIFKKQLKLNSQNGDLTITNIRTEQTGLYNVRINFRQKIIEKSFSVSGVRNPESDQLKSVSVKDGDSVTLLADDRDIKKYDVMQWRFQGIRIAHFNKSASEISEDERFRDKLQLDVQTGSLKIKNIRTDLSGLYQVDLTSTTTSSSYTIHQTFNVTVSGEVKSVSVMKGDPLIINTDVPDIKTYDRILFIFGCDDTIADVNRHFPNKQFTLDGKDRDRLKLNDQTGDLTITKIKIEDAGDYELKMSSSRRTIQRRFRVNVSEPGLSPSAVAGLSVFFLLFIAAAAAAGVIFYRRKIAELLGETKILEVYEGESVDLKTKIKDINRDDVIEWRFGETLIAKINPANNIFSTYDGDDDLFRDKLKLNHQTGDLTISDFRVKHTGVYKLKIIRGGKTSHRRFSVFVRERIVVYEGESVPLKTEVNDIQRVDVIEWRFGDKETPIAKINPANNIFSTSDGDDDLFRDKLKLNPQTGDLNIRNIRQKHAGVYTLRIIRDRETSYKKFRVHVRDDLALRGRAVQSSTAYGWVASNAIDNSPFTCTHTDTSDNPWWRLDLLDSYYISRVVITNRKDCCAERLNGAEIRMGNSLENNGNNNPRYAVLNDVAAGQSVSVSCHNTNGRYVNVIIPGSSKILSLAKVEVYQAEDLALRGRAVQSSTAYGWEASNAIDNLPFTCTHTDTSDNPWWRLDLLDSYYISRVVITNRKDCGAERLNGAEIRMGNSLENNGNNNPRYAVLDGVAAGQSVSVSCHNTNGRYVNVIIPGYSKILSLAKVEVYQAEDLALRGQAVQSSTGYGWVASNAIDNLPFTCTHTVETSDNPWWRLDLLDSYYISTVVITNRKDCCAERLNGAEIRIGNSLENNGNNNPRYAVLNGVAAGQSVSVSGHNMNGRYVNVIIPGSSKILSLAKVEVYQAENLALRGRAVQSSTAYGWEASNAIDNLPFTCTHTDTSDNPWWRLDLLDSYYISTVVITNRKDCCAERLNGAEIRIGNSLENNGNNNPRYAVLNGVVAGQSVSVSCDNMNGRYVNVIIPGSSKILSLAQVEVYKAGEDPVEKMGEDPVEAREDPVEAREDPVEKMGEDPVEAREDPVEAREDPVEAREDPVEMREDPVEARGDPVEIQPLLNNSTAKGEDSVETRGGSVAIEMQPLLNNSNQQQ
ncbi:uncharacterized protein [Paramisgurnus dabryanus]|uniref:uncharacterized protein isoform X2 n=1 Tax=Paramisgurnus dabryanus TaxID=90735 RepID=UPI003CCFDFB0